MRPPDHILLGKFAQILRDRLPPNTAPAFIEGNDEQVLSALAVYRNNIRASLSRVLGDKFPVLKQLVGDDFFKVLAQAYFLEHPPTSPLVREYGAQLADFLERFEPIQAYPYIPDVVRLEELWLESYHAADENIMQPDEIIAGAGEDISQLRFVFHSSVRLLSSAYPIASIWRHHQAEAGAEKITITSEGEAVLIARPNRDVRIRVLTAPTYAALDKLSSGWSLEDAVMAVSTVSEDFQPQSFFQELFQLGIIAGLRHKKD